MSDETTVIIRPRPGEPSRATDDGGTGRPLPLAGALAGLAAVGTTLVLCMAVSLIGWFLADAGAHGQTTDALRVGADAWLLGLGAHLSAAGVPIGIIPLGLTAVLLLVGFRCGRWAAAGAHPIDDDRPLGTAVAVATGLYVVVAAIVDLLAARTDASPSLSRAILGALVVSVASCGVGLAAGSGRLRFHWNALPGYLRSIVEGAVAGALLLFAAAAALVAISLVLHFNDASRVISSLNLSVGDALMLTVVSALVAPNAALFAAAYLAGPGFAVGTGTTVTTTSVALGAMPAFPLLAALPGDGRTPGWLVGLLAVPPIVAAIGAGIAQRRYGVLSWDSAALRGFGSGFGAGVLVWLLVCLAGGPMGTGRMADIGAPLGEVLVTAVGGMSIGGLVGGLVVTAWQRRRTPAAERPGAIR